MLVTVVVLEVGSVIAGLLGPLTSDQRPVLGATGAFPARVTLVTLQ